MLRVSSFAAGQWIAPGAGARPITSALTGQVIAEAGNDALDVQAMLAHGRDVGGAALRALSFHDRARLLKALAGHLHEHRQVLYDLSYDSGGTLADHKIDVDGGIGTLLVYASKGRREMPDGHVLRDGATEQLGRAGQFLGQHIFTPLLGTALHINAFNFPVWGMLEKLAPTWLAGMPAIVKPATATCQITEACVRIMLDSGLVPEGALQMIAGGVGDALSHLDCQDVVTFTGSADTAHKLRSHMGALDQGVRFSAEQDSLNATVLGPDAGPGSPEFDLLVREVLSEMTAKAGQKCTAIRRIMVPYAHLDAAQAALTEALDSVTVGNPRLAETQMGALVNAQQKADVLSKIATLSTETQQLAGGDMDGAFLRPHLLLCDDPDPAEAVHHKEAFGPVSTLMPYRDPAHAAQLLNRGQGSLVASVFSNDAEVVREITLGAAPFHGRLYVMNREAAPEATGHGAPLPHMVHGGPGRAGGGEELGGIRAVKHYMQRTAVQGSPRMLSALTGTWVPGAEEHKDKTHPFTRVYGDLQIGDTLHTDAREVTLDDIEHFAHFTGDTFYAHMDEEAAAANPFFPGRVAHGYLLISFAAGLFVQPDPGPVLANTGLDSLRFLKPVQAGDSIRVRLTVKSKTPRNADYGEVRWHVTLTNQNAEPVAEYELLTMNAF